jgi:hypothetical protein
MLNSPEALAHTHHYNIFRCTAPDGYDPESFFEPFIGTGGGECYVPDPLIPVPNCQTMFYNWAVGGKVNSVNLLTCLSHIDSSHECHECECGPKSNRIPFVMMTIMTNDNS